MKPFYYILFGASISFFGLMFIGWLDVVMFNKPWVEVVSNEPVKAYMIAGAWEMSFAMFGFILGLVFRFLFSEPDTKHNN
jgi:hypothetical protein